jgi:hypothetical protein
VGGWPLKPLEEIRTPRQLQLPAYLPQIHNGHSRNEVLVERVVAIPTFCVMKGRSNGGYGPIASDASHLRDLFKLSGNTRIILVSVAEDRHLERFWKFAEYHDVGPALKALKIDAITTPNFSFFTDVPRPHSIWNLARMCRMTEYLSSSGVRVIPHIHAATKADWDFWLQNLRRHEHVNYIVREFQTGAHKKEIGLASIRDLAKFRDKVGRDLHLIAVGGSQFAPVLQRLFPDKFTLVDSNPFVKTHKRQKLVPRPGLRPHWIKQVTLRGEMLDKLMRENIESYRAWLKSRCGSECLFEETQKTVNDRIPPAQAVEAGQHEFRFVRQGHLDVDKASAHTRIHHASRI